MASGTINKYADGTDSTWSLATSYASGGYTGDIYWRRIGDVVNIVAYNIHLKSDLSATYIVLTTTGLPRSKTVTGVVTRELGFVLLTEGGNLRYYKPASMPTVTTSTDITFNISYIAA